jgi:hypothetical protein
VFRLGTEVAAGRRLHEPAAVVVGALQWHRASRDQFPVGAGIAVAVAVAVAVGIRRRVASPPAE